MNAIVAFSFLAILGLLLFSISFGLGWYEKQRKKKLVSMLRTVTQNGEEQHVDLLIDVADQKKQRSRKSSTSSAASQRCCPNRVSTGA